MSEEQMKNEKLYQATMSMVRRIRKKGSTSKAKKIYQEGAVNGKAGNDNPGDNQPVHGDAD